MKKAELDERRRRQHILDERKKERDNLMFRFLREPLRQRREALVAKGANTTDTTNAHQWETEDVAGRRVTVTRSVPDLDEAMRRLKREDQKLDAR